MRNAPLDIYIQLLFLAHSRTVDKAGAWPYMAAGHSLVFPCTQPEIFQVEPQVLFITAMRDYNRTENRTVLQKPG